ncbi:mechanosensitive ion channel family protein [Oceanobacillus chungangensis]|uniref:Uncharacterized protein n=1 Tax=Oceanobacillus chungangensis TaxID=1229152 RepID=A0A3D8Q1V5_9BACI|nr:hypothetical protein [Oceanobacillus chungangensis]RDW20985.1 hypothetical protein CWR45_03830 [Oceanobacillus chungangensis]
MNNMFDQYFSVSFMDGLQNLVIAILVLLIGWIIAKIIGSSPQGKKSFGSISSQSGKSNFIFKESSCISSARFIRKLTILKRQMY